MTLLELINSFYCNEAKLTEPAPWFAFGVFMREADCGVHDVETLRNFVSAKHTLLRSKDYKPGIHKDHVVVFGKSYINDAFLGHVYDDGDKVQRVVFPGYGIRASSTSLAEDWRYLILSIASGVHVERPAILEVVYEDKTVRGFVKKETWEALDELHSRLSEAPKVETPGSLCSRCSKAGSCQSLKRFQEQHDLPPENAEDKQKAHRLWLLALSLRSKITFLEGLWKVVSAKLKERIEEDRININDYFYLEAQSAERVSYPFAPTYAILNGEGRWRSEFGKIQASELKKVLPTLPKDIQDRLESLKQVDLTEPSLREVVHNGEQSIKSSIFVGVSGKKQGRV